MDCAGPGAGREATGVKVVEISEPGTSADGGSGGEVVVVGALVVALDPELGDRAPCLVWDDPLHPARLSSATRPTRALHGWRRCFIPRHFGLREEALRVELSISVSVSPNAQERLVTVTKGYQERRPRTWVEITRTGHKALAAEMVAMRQLVDTFENRATAASLRVAPS